MTGLQRLSDVIGRDVSRETFEKLERHAAMVREWSVRTNLVAPSTIPDLWERHVMDSAQLLRHVERPGTWIDVGSGAGFPGLVVAVLVSGQPGWHTSLVESNRKKVSFLASVKAALNLDVDIVPQRISTVVANPRQRPDIVSARALAPLLDLVTMLEPWLSAGTVGLFHKGREFHGELEHCRRMFAVDLIEHASAIEAGSRVVEIRGLHRLDGIDARFS